MARVSEWLVAVWVMVVLAGVAAGQAADRIELAGGGVTVTFRYAENRLALLQIQRPGEAPMLYADRQVTEPGPGPVGNPLAVVIREGKFQGTYGMDTFRVLKLDRSPQRIRAFLEHDSLPLQAMISAEVEGSVITWLGQVCWNGEEAVDAEAYFPLLSRVRFESPQKDRAITPHISGSVRGPLGEVNYASNYVGRFASPVFLVEGSNRGLAILDGNQADYGPDPSATCLRSYAVGNAFPAFQGRGGEQGPIVGVGHRRLYRPIGDFGGEESYRNAEAPRDPLPLKKLGDSIDLGPIRMYAYEGTWKVGADWLREQRRHVPFRISPAKWYQRTTFVAEEGAGMLVRNGRGFLGLPGILEEKRKLGADLFFITNFSEAELTGMSGQARGDYFLAAQNLGGVDAARTGIEAVHRAGGHVMYYIEGMILWKRARMGRTDEAKRWALMERDGAYTSHYRGFWHMCPANAEYQDWFARTCAEVVRTTGVDGFFIDSTLATYNHRCFNPEHHHPHPDVWTWGIRQLLKRVREEVDKVNPETLLFIEGCADIGREFGDGFIAHSHMWTVNNFDVPLVRFLHPDMRAFESWGTGGREMRQSTRALHIFNAVHGHRIYAHNARREEMADLSLRTRRYYDAFPEICDSPMSVHDVMAQNCLAQLFDGPPRIVTVGNPTDQPVEALLKLPVAGTVLFDRVNGGRIAVEKGSAKLTLQPGEYRAFEIRP